MSSALSLLLSQGISRAETPFSLPRGESSLWWSNEATRWDSLKGADGERVSLGTGVWRATSQLTITHGLLDAWELQGSLGYASSWAEDPSAPGCSQLGASACDPSSALVPFELRAQNRLAAQRSEGGLGSLAWGSALKVGNASAKHRGKLTGIGEGTTDLGLYFTAGRQDELSSLRHRASSSLMARLRPGLGGDRAGSPIEIEAKARSELSGKHVALSGGLHLLHRAGGVSLAEIDLGSADRFTDLSVSLLDGELQLIARTSALSMALTAAGSLWVRDNPADRLYLGLGLGAWLPGGAKEP